MQSRRNFLGTLGIGLVSLASGCSTTNNHKKPNLEIVRRFPEGHIHGYSPGVVNEKQTPYKLEQFTAYGETYYGKTLESTTENQLPLGIFRIEDSTREISLNDGNIVLTSKEIYIPSKARTENGKMIDRVNISPDGKYGKKANINQIKDLRELSSVVTTELDASYNLPTMQISLPNRKQEYFIILTEENKRNVEGKLDIYLIPKTNAKIEIDNQTGNLAIINMNNVYRPIIVHGSTEVISGVVASNSTSEDEK